MNALETGLVDILSYWNWPSDFPEDCPPEQASPANGTYYRIVKNDPPEPDDFVSLYRQNRRRAENIVKAGMRSQCEIMGLSVYADIDDAIQCALRYPRIGDRIASLSLAPESGKVLHTGGAFKSHSTWWKVEEFDATIEGRIVFSL